MCSFLVVIPQLLSPVWPFAHHGLQHTRLLCPSLSPGVCTNSCPLSQWCHPTISSSVTPVSSCPQSFPASRSFPMSQFFALDGQKYWFASSGQSIEASASASSPSSEYSGQISFRIDWFDLLAVQGTPKSLLLHHSLKASILWHSAFFTVQLTSIHDDWKNHSFDYKNLCRQSDVSAF